jgi:hypothetical protein
MGWDPDRYGTVGQHLVLGRTLVDHAAVTAGNGDVKCDTVETVAAVKVDAAAGPCDDRNAAATATDVAPRPNDDGTVRPDFTHGCRLRWDICSWYRCR